MKTKQLTMLIVFISLSTVGSFIKIIPSMGSLAFDSMPALVAAVFLGPVFGAVVGAIGHLISAFIGGMPLGVWHVLIAMEIAVCVFLFGVLYLKGLKKIAIAVFFISNGILALLPFMWIVSPAFVWSILVGVMMSAAMNVGLASILIPRLTSVFTRGNYHA